MLPRLPDDVPVPVFGPRTECTKCEIVGAHARPNGGRESGKARGARWPRVYEIHMDKTPNLLDL
jgi:hypothetical protein